MPLFHVRRQLQPHVMLVAVNGYIGRRFDKDVCTPIHYRLNGDFNIVTDKDFITGSSFQTQTLSHHISSLVSRCGIQSVEPTPRPSHLNPHRSRRCIASSHTQCQLSLRSVFHLDRRKRSTELPPLLMISALTSLAFLMVSTRCSVTFLSALASSLTRSVSAFAATTSASFNPDRRPENQSATMDARNTTAPITYLFRNAFTYFLP